MLVKDMYNFYIYRFRLRNRFRAGLQKKRLQLIFFICLIKGYFVVRAQRKFQQRLRNRWMWDGK